MASVGHHLGGFRGLAVLDLYAGSGALGLEAASRGARQVVLVERDRRAAAVATANAATVGAPGVLVRVASVAAYLGEAGHLAEAASRPDGGFDLVFLDPPYAMAEAEVAANLAALVSGRWLAPGAVVVVERASRGEAPRWPPGIVALPARTYSQTTVWYGRASAPLDKPEATSAGDAPAGHPAQPEVPRHGEEE